MENELFSFSFNCINFIISVGKFGPPYLGMATSAARAALPNPTSAGSFRVSVIHRTLTLTTGSLTCVGYVIILMRAYTHWGLGTPTASQYNIFDSEKDYALVTADYAPIWAAWGCATLMTACVEHPPDPRACSAVLPPVPPEAVTH